MLGPIVFLTLIGLVSSANPGVKARVTQKGMNYASSIAQTTLAKELKTLHLDNQSGKDGHISWELKNIQNRGVTAPSVKIAFDQPHNAVSLSLSGLSIKLHADWRVKYRKGIIKLSTSGSVDVGVKRVSATVAVGLGLGKDGRPSLSAASCSANVGDVDLKFHGGMGKLINLFKHPLEKKVKGILQGQICKIVSKSVNVNGNQEMAKLKVNVELDHRFILDYGLSGAPVVTNTYLDILDKGEVYWKGDKKEAPFTPKPIPQQSDVSRMLYLWVTEYTAHTIFYVAQKHDYLKLNVTKKDLPGKNSTFLDTTCKLLCIGKLIPQIGNKYPNREVKMVVSSTSVPGFSITPKGITVALSTNVDLYAEAPGKQSAYLLTLNVSLSLSVKGEIVNERLVGEIVDHSFDLKVVKTEVGSLSIVILNTVIKGALNLVVIPQLNRIAKSGIDLPVTGPVKFSNTQISLLQGSLMIATDVAYKMSNDEALPKPLPRFTEWNQVAKQLDMLPQEPVFRFVRG